MKELFDNIWNSSASDVVNYTIWGIIGYIIGTILFSVVCLWVFFRFMPGILNKAMKRLEKFDDKDNNF